MHAEIRLATAQPARLVQALRSDLAGAAGGIHFEHPDQLQLEGSAEFVERAFQLLHERLDLPPRLCVWAPVQGRPEGASRNLDFAALAAARHAPKARFRVRLGGIVQWLSAFQAPTLDPLWARIREDLGLEPSPLEGIEVPLGPGDSCFRVDFEAGELRLEARDTGALELFSLWGACLEAREDFQSHLETFDQARQAPSDSVEKEVRELDTLNRSLRTLHILQRIPADEAPAEIAKVGFGRVRAFLESPQADQLEKDVRDQALKALPSPGRTRALVSLLKDHPTADPEWVKGWLDELCQKEPEAAQASALEELFRAGVQPELVLLPLQRLDAPRALRTLAVASMQAEASLSDLSWSKLRGLEPGEVLEAFEPFPKDRLSQEGLWSRLEDPQLDEVLKGSLLARLAKALEGSSREDSRAGALAGHVAAARGDWEGALKAWKLALETTQDRDLKDDLRRRCLEIQLEKDQSHEAVATLISLLESSPPEGTARDRGLAQQALERLDAAEARPLLDPPSGPEQWIRVLRGMDALASNDPQKALSAFEGTGEASPSSCLWIRLEARALLQLGREDEAFDRLHALCLEGNPDGAAWLDLARLQWDRQDPEAAWAGVQRARSLAPKEARVLRLYGELALFRGEAERAQESYREILSRESSAQDWLGLARSLRALDEAPRAVRAYRRVLASDPLDPALELETLRELGTVYDKDLDDQEEALFWLQRFLTRGGEGDEVLERLKEITAGIETFPRSLAG